MVTSTYSQDFPQISAKFLDDNGLITDPWLSLLQSLWSRTGGGTGGSTVIGIPVSVAQGGTGAADGPTALSNLGGLDQSMSQVYGVTGGTANVQTLTLVPAISGYADGQRFFASIGPGPNTGSVTLNVSGKGARTIVDVYGNSLHGGELQVGTLCEFAPFGANIVLLQTALQLGEHFTWTKTITAGDAVCSFRPLPAMQRFRLSFYNIVPVNNGDALWALISIAGSYITANYTYSYNNVDSGGSNVPVGLTAQAQVVIAANIGNSGGHNAQGNIEFYNPAGTTLQKMLDFVSTYLSNVGNLFHIDGGAVYTGSNAAWDGIELMLSTGNFTSGVVVLEGSKFR